MKSWKYLALTIPMLFVSAQEIWAQSRAGKNYQILNMPQKTNASTLTAPKPKTEYQTYYIVNRGETVSVITQKAGVSVRHITEQNDIEPRNLRVGQKPLISKPNNIKLSQPVEKFTLAADKWILLAKYEKYFQHQLLGMRKSPKDRRLIAKVATGFLGAPYKLGGSTLQGIDCSAFVRMIYSLFDIQLPRNALAQSRAGIIVERDEMIEGDLVFFHTYRPFGHVGIYIGNNQFVHASPGGKAIRIDSMDAPYFQNRFQRAVRVTVSVADHA